MATRQSRRPCDPVEVRNRFEGTWCDGFQIAEAASDDEGITRIGSGPGG